MPDPTDEFGIPIKPKTTSTQVDEFGIAIKKKEVGTPVSTVSSPKPTLQSPSLGDLLDPTYIADKAFVNISGVPIQIESPRVPLVNNKQQFAEGLQKRIDAKMFTPEDVDVVSRSMKTVPVAATAFMSNKPYSGKVLHLNDVKTKYEQEIKNSIVRANQDLGRQDDFDVILATPESTSAYMAEIDSLYDAKSKKEMAAVPKEEMAGVGDGFAFSDLVVAKGATEPKFDEIRNRNGKTVNELKQILGSSILDKEYLDTSKSKEERINRVAKLLNPNDYKNAEKAKKERAANGISEVDKFFGSDTEAQTDQLNVNKAHIELALNAKIGDKITYNKSLIGAIKEEALEKQNAGTLTEEEKKSYEKKIRDIETETDGYLKDYEDEGKVIEKYPILQKQKIVSKLNEYNALKSGNVANNDGRLDNVSRDEFLRNNGIDPNSQMVKDVMDDGKLLKDYSLFGGFTGSIADVFINSGKSLGDIFGGRDRMDILADKKQAETFPRTISENDEYQLTGGAKIIQNISNTTAQVIGQGLMQWGTAGMGRLAGLSKVASTAAGSWSSGALSSYDGYLRDSYDLPIETDAGRVAYAALNSFAVAASEGIFSEAKIFENIPGVKENIAEIAGRLGTKGFTDDMARELLDKSRKGILDYGRSYAKNVGQEVVEETATSFFESGSKILFGDPNMNLAKAVSDAKDVAIQTAIGTSFIAGFGARSDMQREKNMSAKSTIYNAALHHDEAMDAIKKGFDNGLYDEAEKNSKVQILNTARNAVKVLDQTQMVSGASFSRPQKELYVANLTAEALLTQQKKVAEEPLLQQTIQEKITALQDQRKGLLEGKVRLDDKGNFITSPIISKDEISKATNNGQQQERVNEGETPKEQVQQQREQANDATQSGNPQQGQQVASGAASTAAPLTSQQEEDEAIGIVEAVLAHGNVPALMIGGMKESPVKAAQMIADQALGMGRKDGERAPIEGKSANKPQYELAVEQFGKDAVDRSIALYPLEEKASPSVGSDVEAKKADIEKRREQEFIDKAKKVSKSAKNLIETAGMRNLTEVEAASEVLSNLQSPVEGKDYFNYLNEEVNKKYDAELASLESKNQSSNPIVDDISDFQKNITPKQLKELLNKEGAATKSASGTGATKRQAGDYLYSSDRDAFNALLSDIQNGENKESWKNLYDIHKKSSNPIENGTTTKELTVEEKKDWSSLSMAEKIALAKDNLPEVESLSNADVIKVADTRAKELLAQRQGVVQPTAEPETKPVVNSVESTKREEARPVTVGAVSDKFAAFKERKKKASIALKPAKEKKPAKVLKVKDLKRAEHKKVFARVRKIDVASDARGMAYEYFANGGKINDASFQKDVLGNKQRAKLNTGQQVRSEEVKSLDFVESSAKTIPQVAHEIWDNLPEELQQRVDTQDLENELIGVAGDHKSRLEIGKAYLEQYEVTEGEMFTPEERAAIEQDPKLRELIEQVSSLEFTDEEATAIDKFFAENPSVTDIQSLVSAMDLPFPSNSELSILNKLISYAKENNIPIRNEAGEVQSSTESDGSQGISEEEKGEADAEDVVPFSVTGATDLDLQEMKEIVRDLIEDGTTRLAAIQKLAKKELGKDYDGDLVEDAYYEVSKEVSLGTTNELTSSFAKRINSFVSKVFGKKKDYIKVLKDSKALIDKASQIMGAKYLVNTASTKQVGAAFKSLVEKMGNDRIAGLLMNWNESELSDDGSTITNYVGRDSRYSKGKEGGAQVGGKKSFIEWLLGEGPFDEKVYGKDMRKEEEWVKDIDDARTILKEFGDTNEGSVENGEVVVYHGSGRDFSEFKNGVSWFTKAKDFAEQFGKRGGRRIKGKNGRGLIPTVYSAKIKIKKPLQIGDIHERQTFSELMKLQGLSDSEIESIAKEIYSRSSIVKDYKKEFDKGTASGLEPNREDWVPDTLGNSISRGKWTDAPRQVARSAYEYFDVPAVVEVLKSKGFDGIVAKENGHDTYAVFDGKQTEIVDRVSFMVREAFIGAAMMLQPMTVNNTTKARTEQTQKTVSADEKKITDLLNSYYKENNETPPQDVIDRAIYLWKTFGSPKILPDSTANDDRAFADSTAIGNITNFNDFIAELSHSAQYVSGIEMTEPVYASQKQRDNVEYNRKGSVESEAHKKIEPVLANYVFTGEKKDLGKIRYQNVDGTVLGFTDPSTGEIFLNNEALNPNTPIHEAGHIWTEWAQQKRSDLYNRGMELVAKSRYLNKVKANNFYQNEASKLGAEDSVEYENYMKHEALAMAIGDKGAQFVVESKKKSFAEWATDLWNAIAKAAGFKNITARQLQNLTFDEFTKRAAADILKGGEIQEETTQESSTPRNKKSVSDTESNLIRTVLDKPIDAREFPTFFDMNKEGTQLTAKTQGEGQARQPLDGTYVTAHLEDLRSISLNNARILQEGLGTDWKEKVVQFFEDNPTAGNIAQVSGLLNVINTGINDDIIKSKNGSEISRLKDIQARADRITYDTSRSASLALNQRRMYQDFGQGRNVADILSEVILTPEEQAMKRGVEEGLKTTFSDADLNKPKPPRPPRPPKAPKAPSPKKSNDSVKDDLISKGKRAAQQNDGTGNIVTVSLKDKISQANEALKGFKC